jgi:hypothetical protein
MKHGNGDLFKRISAFSGVGLLTCLVLLVPALMMRFHIALPDPGGAPEVPRWSPFDFLIMGILTFSLGSIFILAARRYRTAVRRIALASLFFLGFLYLWAELAVGIFTDWGS